MNTATKQNKLVFEIAPEQLMLFYAHVRQVIVSLPKSSQKAMDDMVEILMANHADSDQKAAAMDTMIEALHPQPHDGKLGLSLEESEGMGASHSDHVKLEIESLKFEEEVFATRLRKIMEEKNVTQEQLAGMTGVSQSAISHMLTRHCRPQKRTIKKLADALEVTSDSLWPKC